MFFGPFQKGSGSKCDVCKCDITIYYEGTNIWGKKVIKCCDLPSLIFGWLERDYEKRSNLVCERCVYKILTGNNIKYIEEMQKWIDNPISSAQKGQK